MINRTTYVDICQQAQSVKVIANTGRHSSHAISIVAEVQIAIRLSSLQLITQSFNIQKHLKQPYNHITRQTSETSSEYIQLPLHNVQRPLSLPSSPSLAHHLPNMAATISILYNAYLYICLPSPPKPIIIKIPMLSPKSTRLFSHRALRFLFSTTPLTLPAQRAIWATKFLNKILNVSQVENITDPSMIEQLRKLEVPTSEFTMDPAIKEQMLLAFKNGVALDRPFFTQGAPYSVSSQPKTDIYPNALVTRQLFALLAREEKEKCLYGRRGLDKIASYALFHHYSSLANQYTFAAYQMEEFAKLKKDDFIGSFPKTLYLNPHPKTDEELKTLILDQSPELPPDEKAALLLKPYPEFVPAYRKHYQDRSIRLQAVMTVEERDEKERPYYDFLRRFGEIGCEKVYMSDTTLTPHLLTKPYLDLKTKTPLEITISHANCFQNKWGEITVHQHAWSEIKKVLESKGISQEKLIKLKNSFIEMGFFIRQSSGCDNWCGIADFQDTRDMVSLLREDKSMNDALKESMEKNEFEQLLRNMVKQFSARRREQYSKALGYFLDHGSNKEREIKFEMSQMIYLKAVKLKREGIHSTGLTVDITKLQKILEKHDPERQYPCEKLLKTKFHGQEVFPIEISITNEGRIGKFAMNPSEFVAVYRQAMKEPLLKMVGLLEGDIEHYEKRAPFANEPKTVKTAPTAAAVNKDKRFNELSAIVNEQTVLMKQMMEKLGISSALPASPAQATVQPAQEIPTAQQTLPPTNASQSSVPSSPPTPHPHRSLK